jgi:hypothetical protein
MRTPLKDVYVDKDAIHKIHQRHLQRYPRGPGADRALYDLHLSLLRVKDLDGLATDDRYHEEFFHPTLEELVPSGACNNEHRHGLLHRSKSKTNLRKLSSCDHADDPHHAPYYLFGLPGDANAKAIRRIPSPGIDVVLLDLTRAGRARLKTADWRQPVKTLLREIRSIRSTVPVLAITDDPWVHRELTWSILKQHDDIKGKRPAAHSAVYTPTHSIPDLNPEVPVFQGCGAIEAKGFAGQLDSVLAAVDQLKVRAARLSDVGAESILSELAALLRRCANLPGGVADVGTYAANEAGDTAAIHIMAAYQAPKLIAQMERLEGPLAQARKQAISDLGRSARTAWDKQCVASPMASLLADALKPLLGNSSRTVVLLRKAVLADYAEWALRRHPDIGGRVSHRLGNGMLRFMDEIGFREASGLPKRERHQIRTVVLVCPTRFQLLSHMAQPWLPECQVILADAHMLSAVARDARQLAQFPAFSLFAARLERLSAAAQAGADQVMGRKVVLDPLSAPPEDVNFPTARLVDLSGTSKSPDDVLIKLETDDSQTVLARKRTKLVGFDAEGAVPTYYDLTAANAEIGDAICVIDDDFIDMARSRLDIAYAASDEMRAYHMIVLKLFSTLPGFSARAKRLELAKRINTQPRLAGDREASEENVRYWVDLERELQLPLEEVTPRAPQDMAMFLRFTHALGIAAPVAQHFWRWAVICTRSNRLKAAHRLHEAYMGILIAPHAAEAENPRRLEDIRALRAAAEGFVSRIRSKTLVTRAELCA